MYDLAKFLHIITAVFMSVPLYNLVVVNERGRMGKGVPADVDRFFETSSGEGPAGVSCSR